MAGPKLLNNTKLKRKDPFSHPDLMQQMFLYKNKLFFSRYNAFKSRQFNKTIIFQEVLVKGKQDNKNSREAQ